MKRSWFNTTDSFKSMIIGKLLGDGSITKQKGRRPRFQFTHVHTDYKWCLYCYEQLSQSIPLNPPVFKKTLDPRLKKGYSLAYYSQSKTSKVICYLRKIWYADSGKIVPFNLIKEYFNNQSLAWWYMDDGHLKINGNNPEKIILSTDGFTTNENKWLIKFLHKKYHLYFRLDKQNRIILYDQFQIFYFLNLIQDFMHESMYRKVLPYQNINYKLLPRRTTLYLPISIHIKFPTKEINLQLKYLDELLIKYKAGIFYREFRESLFLRESNQQKGYQIVIEAEHLSNLQLLKKLTGLTFSRLTELCFLYF